jgi:hypothetical protein
MAGKQLQLKLILGVTLIGAGCWLLQSFAAALIAPGAIIVFFTGLEHLCDVLPRRLQGSAEEF